MLLDSLNSPRLSHVSLHSLHFIAAGRSRKLTQLDRLDPMQASDPVVIISGKPSETTGLFFASQRTKALSFND